MRSKTREQMADRYRRGCGRGEGMGYRSWLSAHDVPSRGRTTRMRGRKIPRGYVFLSNLERHAFMAAQRLDAVVDLREQFPLWPLEETEDIAKDLGVRHPARPATREPVLMTTDLLLTCAPSGGGRSDEAIACKPSGELADRRTLEKLEIERVYWERRGTRWSIVTELSLPEGLVRNLDWADEYHDIYPETLDADGISRALGLIRRAVPEAPETPLNRLCFEADDKLGFESGTCLAVFRHAIARKLWRMPLGEAIDPSKPLPKACLEAVAATA